MTNMTKYTKMNDLVDTDSHEHKLDHDDCLGNLLDYQHSNALDSSSTSVPPPSRSQHLLSKKNPPGLGPRTKSLGLFRKKPISLNENARTRSLFDMDDFHDAEEHEREYNFTFHHSEGQVRMQVPLPNTVQKGVDEVSCDLPSLTDVSEYDLDDGSVSLSGGSRSSQGSRGSCRVKAREYRSTSIGSSGSARSSKSHRNKRAHQERQCQHHQEIHTCLSNSSTVKSDQAVTEPSLRQLLINIDADGCVSGNRKTLTATLDEESGVQADHEDFECELVPINIVGNINEFDRSIQDCSITTKPQTNVTTAIYMTGKKTKSQVKALTSNQSGALCSSLFCISELFTSEEGNKIKNENDNGKGSDLSSENKSSVQSGTTIDIDDINPCCHRIRNIGKKNRKANNSSTHKNLDNSKNCNCTSCCSATTTSSKDNKRPITSSCSKHGKHRATSLQLSVPDNRNNDNGMKCLSESKITDKDDIQEVQKSIEFDIFELMGLGLCASSAKHWMMGIDVMDEVGETSEPGHDRYGVRSSSPTSFMNSLRKQCPYDCQGGDEDDDTDTDNEGGAQLHIGIEGFSQGDHTDDGPIESRLRNRGVCRREKARIRIQRLRESGLSRNFSIVSSFLEEETAEMEWLHRHHWHRRQQEGGVGARKSRNHPAILGTKSLDSSSYQKESSGSSFLKNENIHHINHGCGESNSANSTTFFARSSSCIAPDVSCTDHQSGSNACTSTNISNQGMNLLIAVPSVDSQDSEIELFYDSDPGNDRSRNTMLTIDEDNVSVDNETNIAGTHGKTTRRLNEQSTESSNLGLLRSFDVNSFNLNDSEMISQLIKVSGISVFSSRYINNRSLDSKPPNIHDSFLIHPQELTTGNMLLLWHSLPPSALKNMPTTTKSSKTLAKTIPPIRIKAWFEMGSCLKSTLIQPKFIWRTNNTNDMHTSRRKRIQAIQAPEFVELLNIVRIMPLTSSLIDRNIHPFAKADCCFKLVPNDTSAEVIFEAATKDDRDRFVFAMKIVIARLASKIIVGDKDVFDEFFSTRPTQAPRKLKPPSSSPSSAAVSLDCDDHGGHDYDECSSGRDTPTSRNSMSPTQSFCSTLVQPVAEESSRQDELWGQRG